MYFSRSLIPYPREDTGVVVYKHIGIYGYRRDFLLQYAKMQPTPLEQTESLEQLRALENGYKIKVIATDKHFVGVDTKEDLEEVKKRKYLFVAGGVGSAPVYPQVKWMHEHGIDVDVIEGSKTKSLLILEDKLKAVAGNLYVTTDDGSYERKGMVTEVIKDLVENQGKKYDVCVAHRTNDHDEIRMSPYKETGNPYCCKYEPDHGRWNRYVRSLSSACRR